MDVTTTALVLAWGAIVVLAFGMAGLLRQIEELRRGGVRPVRRIGPALNALAPSVEGLATTTSTILLFADEHCATCETVLREAADLPSEAGRGFEIVALYRGGGKAGSSRVRTLSVSAETFESFGVTLTPYAVAIGRDGTVLAAGLIGSAAEFESFLSALVPQPLTLVSEVAR